MGTELCASPIRRVGTPLGRGATAIEADSSRHSHAPDQVAQGGEFLVAKTFAALGSRRSEATALASSDVMPVRNPKAVCCLWFADWARAAVGAKTASATAHATVQHRGAAIRGVHDRHHRHAQPFSTARTRRKGSNPPVARDSVDATPGSAAPVAGT